MVELRNKGRWRKKLWIFLGCGIALVLILALWREREPRYEDHSLLEWIAIAENGDKDSEYSNREGQEAVRHIGSNAIPFLTKCIEYRERPWQTRLGVLCDKLPGKLAGPLSGLIAGHAAKRQQVAFSGLYILGPDAKAALPVLTNLLTAQPPLVYYSITVLAQIGGDGLTPVLNLVTNQASPNRFFAFDALAAVDTNRPLDHRVVSALTNCLADANRQVAFYAAQILCCHNSEKELAMKTLVDAVGSDDKKLRRSAVTRLGISLRRGYSIPALLQFLQDTNSPLSPYSASALGELAYDGAKLPDTVLPALTNSFHDPRPMVRAYAAYAIVRFNQAAEPAAPALLDLWNDPAESVRQAATNAFYQLPSYNFLQNLGPWPVGLSEEQAEMYERRYGLPRPAPALTRLLNHPDIRIREMATNALRTLQGSNLVNRTHENASR
jgi:HEAT repeat protein